MEKHKNLLLFAIFLTSLSHSADSLSHGDEIGTLIGLSKESQSICDSNTIDDWDHYNCAKKFFLANRCEDISAVNNLSKKISEKQSLKRSSSMLDPLLVTWATMISSKSELQTLEKYNIKMDGLNIIEVLREELFNDEMLMAVNILFGITVRNFINATSSDRGKCFSILLRELYKSDDPDYIFDDIEYETVLASLYSSTGSMYMFSEMLVSDDLAFENAKADAISAEERNDAIMKLYAHFFAVFAKSYQNKCAADALIESIARYKGETLVYTADAVMQALEDELMDYDIRPSYVKYLLSSDGIKRMSNNLFSKAFHNILKCREKCPNIYMNIDERDVCLFCECHKTPNAKSIKINLDVDSNFLEDEKCKTIATQCIALAITEVIGKFSDLSEIIMTAINVEEDVFKNIMEASQGDIEDVVKLAMGSFSRFMDGSTTVSSSLTNMMYHAGYIEGIISYVKHFLNKMTDDEKEKYTMGNVALCKLYSKIENCDKEKCIASFKKYAGAITKKDKKIPYLLLSMFSSIINKARAKVMIGLCAMTWNKTGYILGIDYKKSTSLFYSVIKNLKALHNRPVVQNKAINNMFGVLTAGNIELTQSEALIVMLFCYSVT